MGIMETIAGKKIFKTQQTDKYAVTGEIKGVRLQRTPFDMAETGCKPAAVKMFLYGSYRKVLGNQRNFVAKERYKVRRPDYEI